MAKNKKYNVPFVTSFFRYNAAALTASTVDFTLSYIGAKILHLDYRLATFLAALSGGIVAFLLGRNWTYLNKEEKVHRQGWKYVLVWAGSILLNTLGVHFFIEIVGIDENYFMYVRVLTACMVGAFYNFPLQRYFVFG